ncbi:MAG: DUF3575 domain-containing protein [Bacteroidales bacterium]|nr:DUF3575 domain-containing protein [Bacteroidales bacterium]MDD3522160.1 DUF3575 domain-containing protein [Bacteroidales bacterium]MDD4029976.1 DUF3575 domain-containing protein [Bacteroidales bacterium]MDD4434751.1 DUF3575 domain-containing protein [Bacteroidales bacterium]MDD5732712.1 DUF3575 domain-containing protein [Bacteroidales bacterium]
MDSKRIALIGALFFYSYLLSAQEVAIKSNIFYDATTTFNLGVEVALSKQVSLEFSGNYNPWNFSQYRKIKHWMIQPEVRYWSRAVLSGHYFGFHGLISQFNVGNIPFLGLEGVRHQGFLYGGGISYGYLWRLTSRVGLEVSLGAGYAYIDYETIAARPCGPSLGRGTKHYVGPTKAGLTLVFLLK